MITDILTGLLSLIVLMMGAWCRSQENKITDLQAENAVIRKEMTDRWVKDAETFVTKEDFKGLARELKETLVRIEDKIERLRG